MYNARIVNVFLVLTCFAAISLGQAPASSSASAAGSAKAGFMPLSELREGMRGTARTVFRGSEPEEFNVEILGVLPGGIGPKQDLIVGRLSGGSADRTSVFAGMSGSPVYIDGKLVGAISYSFPFSKEPICGITPIEQMVAIFEHRGQQTGNSEPRSVSFAELASTEWSPDLPRTRPAGTVAAAPSANSSLAAVAGQAFQPIATPITFTGFRQETLDIFAPQLMSVGLLPVSAAGGAAKIGPIKPADATTLVGGDSVSMQLTRGDFSLSAAGTVTLRDGEKIYAFGHPFLSLGSSDLPMSESHVVAVVPNVNNSFKIAVPDAMVGAMTQDRATGVFGKLGKAPAMIPVRLNLQTSRGSTDALEFEVARDEFLTPLLLNIAIYNALIAQERSLGDTLVSIRGEIAVAGREPVAVDRRFSGAQAGQHAAAAVAIPVGTLLRSRFDDLNISGITLNLSSIDGSRTATLERITLDRTEVRPGETVNLQAFARTSSGRIFVQNIPVTIPSDTPAGTITISVGDGSAMQQNASIKEFVPADLTELVRTMNKAKMPDRLYVQAFRTTRGAIIGASELPNLPPSVMATLNNQRTAGGVKPVVQTVVTEVRVDPAEFLIVGQQTLNLEVIR